MKFGQMVVGPLSTNCYFLENTDTHELLLADPGGNQKELQKRIEELGCTLTGILLTHGHGDHIMAVPALKEAYPQAKVYVCAAEKELLGSKAMNCSGMIGYPCSFDADVLLYDGDVLEISGMKIQVIATPGHTAGSCCYYLPDEKLLLSGDTLFEGSIGRTDLPTGNMSRILDSLQKLFEMLPEDTDVFPGHGGSTSIAYEKSTILLHKECKK